LNINSFFSINQILSYSSTLFYFRYLLFIFGTIYLITNQKDFIYNFFISLFITFLILSLDAIFQNYVGYNIIGLKTEHGRISSFFGEEYVLGNFLARLFPLFLGLYFYNNNVLYFQYKTFLVLNRYRPRYFHIYF